MKAKEKAKELLEKFMQPIDSLHKYPMCFDTAKQCALIAVDEIITNRERIKGIDKLYWQQVKHELNKSE